VPAWAKTQLETMGGLTNREIVLAGLVTLALAMWIFGSDHVNASTAALVVVCLMLVLGVVTWDDMVRNSAAWNTLVWFATLVALADGLARVGFVKWFAGSIAGPMGGLSPFVAMIGLVLVFYATHYLFASVTAHVTAMLPVMLAAGSTVPGMNMPRFALLLCLSLGIMGILTPYATGPSPVYYGSGYLPSKDYWRLGAIFGVLFLVVFLGLTLPWLAMIG